MAFNIFVLLITLFSAVQAHVPHLRHSHLHSVLSPNLSKRADDDPSDFSWVKRWAAIGDSYTAGIGSGRPLGSIWDGEELDVGVTTEKTLNIRLPNLEFSGHGNWYCARYDMSYPMIINRILGSQVKSFQYTACSGDRAGQIYQQAQQIEGDLDMVMLTAGGNDLCLAGIISECILLSVGSEEACEAVLQVAEDNVENIIENNMKEILYALNKKVNKDGIVVVLGYAEFFSTENADCEDEDWDMQAWLKNPLNSPQRLTLARRHRFNALVRKINAATREAVNDISKDKDIKYKIGFADWNPWVSEVSIDGQMCSPSAQGYYPSKDQPQMQFIKPLTIPYPTKHDDLKKREAYESDYYDPSFGELRRKRAAENIWRSKFFNSANPPELVRRVLGRRDPKPPGCPSDESRDWTMGLGLPNSIGANFHPNENGHVTMASFAMAEAMDLRSLVLGIDAPSCEVKDQFLCWSDEDWKIYASADRLELHYEDFCKNIEQPDHEKGWSYYKVYDEGTPDEHEFRISLSKDVADYNEKQCLDSFEKLIHSCDTKRRLNWKSGGKYVRDDGAYTYEVSPTRYNRPWPPLEYVQGRCEGWYKGSHTAYTIEGGGFSTWDFGQETMRPSIDGCCGLGTTNWKFEYYDKPTEEGYEWKATFNTAIWTRLRCFKNNKVAKAAGGWTEGCSGNG
ncbi:sgnh hydrolase [Fusarium sporotrichioides]|uniref:Sgnh hydrolase n=1 Tax=Fusarium sporotrichioides TaxID=5514 RepID=A0A395SCL3_FUSSP|nr:sgnh hydrolase [Fusarium sporotrichioides]